MRPKNGKGEGWLSRRSLLLPKQTHLISFVADLAAERFPPDVGDHMALQQGRCTENLPTGRAWVVLPGVGCMDVLLVLLQGGEAHLALLAVIGVVNV